MATWPYESGYCEATDVQVLFPNSGNFTQLTDARIQGAIMDTAVEMDGLLSRFYVTPVSADPAALQMLRVINKYFAAAFIHKEFYVAGQPNKSQGQDWRVFGQSLLDKIVPPRSNGGAMGQGSTGDGAQPYPSIRFFLAPVANPTELPDFPEGGAATFNPDNDAVLNPTEEPFFRRNDRTPWQGGLI